ncbi:MAG: hypothetical protein ILP07_05670 [Treponema sp.]|nr:hypothetical protein [Treponema sp.]
MLKLLNRIILPAIGITLWIIICIPICRKAEGIDWFFFWILAGFPFGIRRMFLWLIPKGYGISGTVGVFAVNVVLGGLIGGVVLLGKIAKIMINCGKVVTGNFWT